MPKREPITFTIPVAPVTKKNHGDVFYNKAQERWMYAPSKQYKQYADEAGWFVPKLGISEPINVCAVYYKKDHRKTDLVNLHQALLDVLRDHGAIEDDHCGIVVSMDGSRVKYDKENPRTEVTISFVEGGGCGGERKSSDMGKTESYTG